MNVLTIDVETTISNKGNPFDTTNKLVYVGCKDNEQPTEVFSIEYNQKPYKDKLNKIQAMIDDVDWLVGFNIKFDLSWLKRYGIKFDHKRIWDCQLAHFIMTGQEKPYPSLNGVCEHHGLEQKIDIIKEQYWSNGIDTPDIPEELLQDYLKKDVDLTREVYKKQMYVLYKDTSQANLIQLHFRDLVVLQEMEYNGMLYDQQRSKILGDELDEQIGKLDRRLYDLHGLDSFNPSSVDHLNAFLYGGKLSFRRKVPDGVYKTGARKGEPKEKWETYEVELPQRCKPIAGTELKKDGLYSVDDSTIKRLKGAKDIRDLILTRAVLQKRLTAYYRGLDELITENNWKQNKLHGVLNQCVARTGRLSSSKPNLQNFDSEIKGLLYSRYNS